MASRLQEDVWREFFDLFKSFPEIWKVKCDEYKNRHKKNAAYVILLDKFREIDAKATLETLKSKLNSIRGCYRRELKKKKRSEKSGAGADEIYVPSLWYFEELSFLEDQEAQVCGISTIDIDFDEVDTNQDENASPVAKKAKQELKRNELLAKAVKALDDSTQMKDDATAFSSAWEIVFRKLNPTQQLFANKAIMEVLFQGALNRLDENTMKVLENASRETHVQIRSSSTPFSGSDTGSTYSCGEGSTNNQSHHIAPTSLQKSVNFIPIRPHQTLVQKFTMKHPQQSNVKYITYEDMLPEENLQYESESNYNSFNELFEDSSFS